MNYATDWTALPLERRNALCAEAMGQSVAAKGAGEDTSGQRLPKEA